MVGVFGNDTEARLPGSANYKAKTAATAVVPSGAKSVEVGGARLGKRSRVIEVPKTSHLHTHTPARTHTQPHFFHFLKYLYLLQHLKSSESSKSKLSKTLAEFLVFSF